MEPGSSLLDSVQGISREEEEEGQSVDAGEGSSSDDAHALQDAHDKSPRVVENKEAQKE